MKAAVIRSYGPPEIVRIEEVPTPRTKDDEVLVRIHATTVNSGETRIRGLRMPPGFGALARPMFGFTKPRKPIFGTEFAGVITEVGARVTKFKVGDPVFGFPGIEFGSHAEYRTMPENGRILRMPSGLSFEEGAALSWGGITALHFLRDQAKLSAGETVLIVGASGSVGSAAVQIAKHLKALVTGVTSTPNLDLVKKLGADEVIDYRVTNPLHSTAKFDVILDAVGDSGYSDYQPLLNPGGRLILAAAGLPQMLQGLWRSRGGHHRVIVGGAPEKLEHLQALAALVETGSFRPLIDQVIPFERIAEAHARVDSGRKRGSVVVSLHP